MNADGRRITKARVLNHLFFWLFCTAVITSSFMIAGLDYPTAFFVITMFLPIHLIYYYSISYIIIPKYLFHKKYTLFILSFIAIAILVAFAFRTVEIFFSDPYILKKMLIENPNYKWRKLEGTVLEQYLKPIYIVNAFEQSNQLVWIAISIKFFVLWRADKQASLQAELNFLKNQIHPHFLFNTLNNIYSLALQQSKKSPFLVLKLSEILRYMLYECEEDRVDLRKDISILESYINVERIRYAEKRLDINLNIEGEFEGLTIPPLMMLTFVENAFKHGASEIPCDAWINIEIRTHRNKLTFKISNNKPVKNIDDVPLASGIGLKNIKKRLELSCSDAYQLKIIDEGALFAVVLNLDL
jgi:LytS/YehU family sensor histidine kinase